MSTTLSRGGAVPHFEVRTVDGRIVSYATIWQRRNIVLMALPPADSEAAADYIAAVMSRTAELDAHETDCVVTRDGVAGIDPPGILIADRWGEIIHIATAHDVRGLPAPDEILDWVQYLRIRCPECEGEAR